MFKVSKWMMLSLRIQRSLMEMLMKSTHRIQTNLKCFIQLCFAILATNCLHHSMFLLISNMIYIFLILSFVIHKCNDWNVSDKPIRRCFKVFTYFYVLVAWPKESIKKKNNSLIPLKKKHQFNNIIRILN